MSPYFSFRTAGNKCFECSRLGVDPCNCKPYDGRYGSSGSAAVNTSLETSGGHGQTSPSLTVDTSATTPADTNDESTVDSSDTIAGDVSATIDEVQVDSLAGTSKNQTCYNNPGWRDQLIVNFKSIIIGKCSQKTKDAVDRNESIQVCFPNI